MARAKLPAAFTLPAEVKDLPPELARHVPLTRKQLKKDIAYRDRNFALQGTAARLSLNEQRLNHSRTGIDLYSREVARIEGELAKKRLKRGERARLKDALRMTAGHLADAYFNHGEPEKAEGVLALHEPQSARRAWLRKVVDAISRPDHEHCQCEATEQFIACEVYVRERARFVPLITCSCGHMNVSERPPEGLAALQEARGLAAEGARDETVLKHAEKISRG